MEEKKSFGPIIGIVIIIALVVVGGVYFLKNKVTSTALAPTDKEFTTEAAPVSSGDDLDSIQSDLNVNSSVAY